MKIATAFFTNFHDTQMVPFLSEYYRLQKSGSSNFLELLKMPRLQNYLSLATGTAEIIHRYHDVIAQSRLIIEMINKQYELKD